MKIGSKGLTLIKHFEGFQSKAYICPAGVLTIGYGTTKNVKKGQVVTEAEANALLMADVAAFEKTVTSLVNVPLSQEQFDALVAFTYNVGADAFRTSTLLKLLNQGKYSEVPAQMARWNKGNGKVLAGLVKRRESEGVLFSTGKVAF